MKKLLVLFVGLMMIFSLVACAGVTHCKECDDEAYQDGYCKYHYSVNSVKDEVDKTAKGIYDSIFGN